MGSKVTAVLPSAKADLNLVLLACIAEWPKSVVWGTHQEATDGDDDHLGSMVDDRYRRFAVHELPEQPALLAHCDRRPEPIPEDDRHLQRRSRLPLQCLHPLRRPAVDMSGGPGSAVLGGVRTAGAEVVGAAVGSSVGASGGGALASGASITPSASARVSTVQRPASSVIGICIARAATASVAINSAGVSRYSWVIGLRTSRRAAKCSTVNGCGQRSIASRSASRCRSHSVDRSSRARTGATPVGRGVWHVPGSARASPDAPPRHRSSGRRARPSPPRRSAAARQAGQAYRDRTRCRDRCREP